MKKKIISIATLIVAIAVMVTSLVIYTSELDYKLVYQKRKAGQVEYTYGVVVRSYEEWLNLKEYSLGLAKNFDIDEKDFKTKAYIIIVYGAGYGHSKVEVLDATKVNGDLNIHLCVYDNILQATSCGVAVMEVNKNDVRRIKNVNIELSYYSRYSRRSYYNRV